MFIFNGAQSIVAPDPMVICRFTERIAGTFNPFYGIIQAFEVIPDLIVDIFIERCVLADDALSSHVRISVSSSLPNRKIRYVLMYSIFAVFKLTDYLLKSIDLTYSLCLTVSFVY